MNEDYAKKVATVWKANAERNKQAELRKKKQEDAITRAEIEAGLYEE